MVRRIFTSSPHDPRYHMLSHLSAKFANPTKSELHEPRAAMFLNRFTRTLTIMYATSGIKEILGISSENMRGRSFYYCIAENCLPEAIKCLENAKGNDSLAYLRFWFRDPRQDDPSPVLDDYSDEEMITDDGAMYTTTDTSNQSSEGGLGRYGRSSNSSQRGGASIDGQNTSAMDVDDESKPQSRTSSGDSAADTHEAIFGERLHAESSASSMDPSPEREGRPSHDPIELEAVISCASDGLVVCLRKARPMKPHPMHRPSKPVYANGLFAAPWATNPMIPPIETRPGAGFGTSFAPSLGPQGAHHSPRSATASTSSLNQSDFMMAIREQAIFAWALTGINGSMAEFGTNKPAPGSVPANGLPIWANDARQPMYTDDHTKNGAHR